MSATAESISQAAAEQASSVEETSAAMEEMSASINQNNENAKITDGIANKSAHDAIRGGESVMKTVDAIRLPIKSASLTTSPIKPTCWL